MPLALHAGVGTVRLAPRCAAAASRSRVALQRCALLRCPFATPRVADASPLAPRSALRPRRVAATRAGACRLALRVRTMCRAAAT
jgi:hypothetical protein